MEGRNVDIDLCDNCEKPNISMRSSADHVTRGLSWLSHHPVFRLCHQFHSPLYEVEDTETVMTIPFHEKPRRKWKIHIQVITFVKGTVKHNSKNLVFCYRCFSLCCHSRFKISLHRSDFMLNDTVVARHTLKSLFVYYLQSYGMYILPLIYVCYCYTHVLQFWNILKCGLWFSQLWRHVGF